MVLRDFIVVLFLAAICSLDTNAQNIVKGITIDYNSEKPLQNVTISVKGHNISQTTDANGVFILQNLPNGKHILVVMVKGYETQNYPIMLFGKTINLGIIMMYTNELEEQDLSTITITDDELNDETSVADNIAGLLQFSKDVYLRSAAFEWSSSFYRIRGLDSENGKVLINGIEMNKLYNGRPQWSNWGGLNDVLRNQEFNSFLTPSRYTFGGLLGATNMNVRASKARPGGRITYSSSNRSYQHRIMASYVSGVNKNGWSYTIAAGRRTGNEGFVDGTFYNANSVFAAIEKKINDKHSINFTSIYAPNKRGKSSPNTQEIFNLKDIKYNEYWGLLNGKKVNSRVKEVVEPILLLNHYWVFNKNTSLNTNIAYQFGKVGNSRLDYTFGVNPSPAYYQNLPSAFLEDGNVSGAYEAAQNFMNDGQIDWERIYDANITNNITKTAAAYILYEDRNDDTQLSINSIVLTEINDNISFNGKIEFKKLKSKNFAKIKDLLGSTVGYLDFNRFGNSADQQQNNLQNPNRVVGLNNTFKYNYNLESQVINAFAQVQFKYNKVDFYVAGDISKTSHQRDGLYENGSFPGNLSFGKSAKPEFTNFGIKAGTTYKITGRHLVDFNAGFISKAPTIRNTFSNSRGNNNIVPNLESKKMLSVDISYILRSPIVTAKLTGYYIGIQDATEISFFFADGLSGIGGDDNAFVQEVLTGIDKKHFGAELGIEAQVTPTIKLKGAANFGQYTYDNNPNLKLTSDAFGSVDLGESKLKDYKLATGPQRAYSFGFEYRDPDYWWVGVTGNYLTNIYIDIAPLTRTKNFYLDTDNLPFNDYDPIVAKELLQQERFDDYFTLNAIGGKSWKIGDYYIGMFVSINNILDKEYKTGGFEQGRNANYRTLRDDNNNPKKVFGSKYWYGRGTTYFLNVNFRF